jgi:O-acetyl-ADP-ribose deacetylase (regulator of RNase III)
MPFQIIRNDLTKMQVDAIVNTTNPSPAVGYGVDMGIHQAAGPDLLIARKALGTIPVGSAGITNGYDLPAKHVIHTVCPVWQGGDKGEVRLLRRAYTRSLEIAHEAKCRSVAFPLMSAGNHGFPKTVALQTAVDAISAFLMDHEMMVYMVVFSREAVAVSEKLFQSVESYIDEHYIDGLSLDEVATATGISRYYVSHLFKELMDTTFVGYVNELRLNRAAMLLMTSDSPIIEIAALSGFNNLSNFNRAFKLHFGKTPSAYRKS